MRITNLMKREQFLLDVSRLQNDVFLSQRVLNTGKEVSRPSDDPAATRRIMLLTTSKDRRDQYTQNISDGIARLSYSEAQLMALDDLLVEARTLVLKASNAATHDDDRRAIADRIDQMIYEAVSIANSRHEDQYIFGGYNTQDAPYELILDPDPNSDEVVGVQSQPQHMDKTIYRLTADGERVPANVAGNDIFQPGSQGDTDDLFQILVDLRDAMNDGILNDPEQDPPLPPSDPNYDPADPVWTEAEYDSLRVIQEGLERVDGALTRTRSALTRVGGWVKRMQNTEQRHMDLDVRESEHLADTQDADLTEWITKFQLQSIALQQAMNVGNQVLHASLVNFIR